MATYSKTISLGGAAGVDTYDIPIQEKVIRYLAWRNHAIAVGAGETGTLYLAILDGETYIAPRGGMGGLAVPNDGLLIAFYDDSVSPKWSGPKLVDWPEAFRMRGPGYTLRVRLNRTSGLNAGYGNLLIVTSES